MLSALIIVFREVLEAGLIISALLAAAHIRNTGTRGLTIGLCCGIVGALIIANHMDAISNIGDGIGQELLNALLDIVIIVMLAGSSAAGFRERAHPLLAWFAATAIACAVSREFSEIVIYASGFSTSVSAFIPVFIGGAIGTGIGVSIGALLYYLLVYQPAKRALLVTALLLALIAAGMGAEAIGYFDQAGLAPAQQPLWDTTPWLAEGSIGGQLLHALIGYEATPTPLQAGAYALIFFFIGGLGWVRARAERKA